MATIEERLIQALSEIIDENTYSPRYGDSKCSCCHQRVDYYGAGAHEDSCSIPLLGSLRWKLMEGTDGEDD